MKTTSSNAVKLLFKVNNGCVEPVRGQSDALDKLFGDKKVIDANIKNYNSYTKKFVENNNSGFFVSEQYEWDAKHHTFNFSNIEKATDADIDNAFASASGFNAKVSVNAMQEKKQSTLDFIRDNMKCPNIEENGFYVDELNWKYISRNIIKRKNTLLVGPTGTGKTELVMEVAKRLGMECAVYDMGAMLDPLTDLIGAHRLVNGESKFDLAKFVSDIQKPGVILLDELSRAPLIALNILFPCLDSRRELRLDIADSSMDRVVKVHPDCVFVATANIGAEYCGAQEIDAALMNRFLPLRLDYMPRPVEAKVLAKRAGVSDNIARQIAEIAGDIREAEKNGSITMSISTRETIAIAEMVGDGFSLNDAVQLVLLNKCNEDDAVSVKSIIIGI